MPASRRRHARERAARRRRAARQTVLPTLGELGARGPEDITPEVPARRSGAGRLADVVGLVLALALVVELLHANGCG